MLEDQTLLSQKRHFNDFAVKQDSEGIFDIQLCPDQDDFLIMADESSALVVSLFSDRRARDDEVADPMKRRGWIGDLVADVPGDRIGSGLWLYEQRRLTPEVASGVRAEAQLALQWMVDDELMTSVSVEVTRNLATRSITIGVTAIVPQGGVFSEAYQLALNTRTGTLIHP